MRIRLILGVMAIVMGIAQTAGAAFTPSGANGVEPFAETTKDTAAWEQYISGAGTITQNNGLTFSGESDADYTTRQARIPVGGFARVDARVNTSAPGASAHLFLTNNSGGTGSFTFNDSYWLAVGFGSDGGVIAQQGGSGTGSGQTFGTLAAPGNVFYTIEIQRPTATSATYNIYNTSSTLLDTFTWSVPANADALYVSLSGGGASSVTFGSVSIPLSAVPEPVGLLVVPAGMLVLGRRRRSVALIYRVDRAQ